jgi:peroxiredoxin
MNFKVFGRVIGLFYIVILASCHDKDAVIISGEVENTQKIKTIYLLQPDTANAYSMTTVDSVALSDDHRFKFKRQAFFPTFYKLLIGANTYDLIGQNGEEISFKINARDTANSYQVSGSTDSEKMRELNRMANHYSAITTKLSNEYGGRMKKVKNKADSDAVYALYYPKFINNMDGYCKNALGFIDSNKNSLAGFLAAKTLDRYKYEQQLVAYSDAVKDKFPGNKDVQNFVKSFMAVKPVSVGHKAPDFELTDIDKKPVKLSDYKGKYVMIDFWASWCQPCRQENPNVVKQYAQFKDKGFNILGVSLDDDKKAWQTAISKDNLSWRQAAQPKRFDGPVTKLYIVEAIPSNFIIDPQGVIVAKNITGKDLDDFLSKTFSKSQ